MKNYQYKTGQIEEVKQVKEQDNKGNSIYIVSCPRCGGHGKLEQFNHVQEGECFKCGGTGEIEKQGKLYTLEDAQKLQSKYIARKQKEQVMKEESIQKQIDERNNRIKLMQEKARAERIKYQEEKKNSKKLSKKEIVDKMLEEKDISYLRYHIGNMTESQMIKYIELLKSEGDIKKAIKRTIVAHFEDNHLIIDML